MHETRCEGFCLCVQICQQVKDLIHHASGLLQLLLIPEWVFEDIAMDFITCLPSSKWIMTIVDRLSKDGHFISLPSIFTAKTLAEAFVVDIICLDGPPHTIVSDCNPRLIHQFWQEIYWLQGTTLAMSTHKPMDTRRPWANAWTSIYVALWQTLQTIGMLCYCGLNIGTTLPSKLQQA